MKSSCTFGCLISSCTTGPAPCFANAFSNCKGLCQIEPSQPVHAGRQPEQAALCNGVLPSRSAWARQAGHEARNLSFLRENSWRGWCKGIKLPCVGRTTHDYCKLHKLGTAVLDCDPGLVCCCPLLQQEARHLPNLFMNSWHRRQLQCHCDLCSTAFRSAMQRRTPP